MEYSGRVQELELSINISDIVRMAKDGTFGDRLYELRKRARLTQRQLADSMKVDFTYVSKIESGSAPPPARDRIELAVKVLKATPDEAAELFRLADKIPADVTTLISRQPGALRLFRSIREVPARDQADLLEDLIRKVETRRQKGKKDPEEQ